MRLRVHGGQLVTESGQLAADVLCEAGKIIAVVDPEGRFAADEVVDARGRLVFPGFIDPHVHSRDPGMTHKEDFAHATLGSLTGGVTTVLEMPNTIPPVDSVRVFEQRKAYHERSAWTDFGLWGLALGDDNLDQILPMFQAGAVAVKLFWGYALRRDTRALVYNAGDEPPENLLPPPDNGAVLRIFREVAAAGGLLAAHCEDKDILNVSEAILGHPIETYDDLLAARPDTAEAVTISIATSLAAASGCRFHVVHIASAAGVAAVRAARDRGIPVTAESCPQYLTLTDADFPRIGPVMKVYPPIRGGNDQAALWEGIGDDVIVSVGSDHAPHTVEEKSRDLATQPAGVVGCETLGPLMVDAMVRGRLSATRLAAVLSSSTARLYGLYPRKGAILPGSDADLTIVDPTATRTIRNENLVAKQPISPWHRTELRGVPCAAVLRGVVVMQDGEPIGDRRGQYVGADHTVSPAELFRR